MNRPDCDVLLGFHFETAAVRGHLVRLESSLAEILGQHFYPAPVAALLGETLAASVLLGATIKFAGSLSVQAKSADRSRSCSPSVPTSAACVATRSSPTVRLARRFPICWPPVRW